MSADVTHVTHLPLTLHAYVYGEVMEIPVTCVTKPPCTSKCLRSEARRCRCGCKGRNHGAERGAQ